MSALQKTDSFQCRGGGFGAEKVQEEGEDFQGERKEVLAEEKAGLASWGG